MDPQTAPIGHIATKIPLVENERKERREADEQGNCRREIHPHVIFPNQPLFSLSKGTRRRRFRAPTMLRVASSSCIPRASSAVDATKHSWLLNCGKLRLKIRFCAQHHTLSLPYKRPYSCHISYLFEPTPYRLLPFPPFLDAVNAGNIPYIQLPYSTDSINKGARKPP